MVDSPPGDLDGTVYRRLPFLHHKELVGYVQPLSDTTRPNVAIATSPLSRFMQNTPAIH